MLNFRNIKRILQGTAVFFLFVLCGPLFADDKGQIININQSYQIAFTDLGNSVLRQGDIVKVSISTDDFVYMQVLESSSILSKLGPSQVENFRTNLKDFQGMAVGNEVAKVNQTQENTDQSTAATRETKDIAEPKDTANPSDLQIQKLEGDLALAKEEIKNLEEVNEESKMKLNKLAAESQAKTEEPVAPPDTGSKEILGQVKVHLDNIRKLIDENN